MLPTTMATVKDLPSIGVCREAHLKHLITTPAADSPSGAGFLKPNDQPFLDLRPHVLQMVVVLESWGLVFRGSVISKSPDVK